MLDLRLTDNKNLDPQPISVLVSTPIGFLCGVILVYQLWFFVIHRNMSSYRGLYEKIGKKSTPLCVRSDTLEKKNYWNLRYITTSMDTSGHSFQRTALKVNGQLKFYGAHRIFLSSFNGKIYLKSFSHHVFTRALTIRKFCNRLIFIS